MGQKITLIPADTEGNKLFLKGFRQNKGKLFVEYKSTFNNMPFFETELFLVDDKKNYAITGENGAVLFRFAVGWLNE